ncbi:hypothetical protein BCR36DRAFT_160944 [Piromyces finnis]|uniref:Uncharacterized protein n=1 Tax=Piromyces finnis TaxID=1754191 RepID=A0A1Y1UXF3_9FUNG|nr:hypothetical protein BCR36DRAFT_160944 [Piromyces finnis]|eukprot:ORX42203.1 hypothetical protein BCR36DRAFT_160944 [Piromyces finnis]
MYILFNINFLITFLKYIYNINIIYYIIIIIIMLLLLLLNINIKTLWKKKIIYFIFNRSFLWITANILLSQKLLIDLFILSIL